MKKILVLILLTQLSAFSDLTAQKPDITGSSEIQQKLQKLKVLGNVLYVAAHPDDENTRLITYLANDKMVNAAYFSCTRGDGGQNLIGPEIREQLGLIRTQELLAARRIDHGEQYFSRAVDFGYSKDPDETFNIWDKEKVLGDLVWVIRNFKPDVIITRFNTVPRTTHGHHTASAILAEEAFDLAADASAYPEQLQYVDTWQADALYWNTYFWRRSEHQKDTSELIRIDVGGFNPYLGMSYTEIAALSRSSHKSQGFGASGTRGIQNEYLQFVKGNEAKDNMFESIDLSWGRAGATARTEDQIDKIIDAYQPSNPTGILKDLIALRKSVEQLDDVFWREHKLDEIDDIIYALTGLYLEAKAADYTACPGETIKLEIEAINRSSAKINLEKIVFGSAGEVVDVNSALKQSDDREFQYSFTIPADAEYSQPYWLVNKGDVGMFNVSDQQLIGKGENDPALTALFILDIEGEQIQYLKPVIYKRNDPVRGEVYRPFVITPPVYVNISGSVLIFANQEARQVQVEVKAGTDSIKGTVTLDLPQTWKVSPKSRAFNLINKGETATLLFDVTPPVGEESAVAGAVAEINGKKYSNSFTEINYDHIPAQLLFNSDDVSFIKLNLKKGDEKIGYLMGAGDNIPENLRQIGYEVDIINDLDFSEKSLDQYDVIILGIRALNTVDRLKFDMDNLLKFVYRGGNLIIQYNTSHNLVTDNFAPYPLSLSRDRITVEDAKITILDPENQLVNYPNKIEKKDFDGWVQERGLYFPGSWSKEYTPVFSGSDPGEDPLPGGMLIANYGKGTFIYSGYSWFRELPAGVPGAYRIFVNMISAHQNR